MPTPIESESGKTDAEIDRRVKRLEDSLRAEENIVPPDDGGKSGKVDELTRAVERSNRKRSETD